MKKFKLIIAPSSNDEHLFNNAVTYNEALKVINAEGVESAQEFTFSTKTERECFIQGYKAAIGYNGDGLLWTTEKEVQKEGTTYARKCSITGEGMNEGFMTEGITTEYFKYKKDAVKWAKNNGYKTLNEAHNDEAICFTNWSEDEHEYIVKNGELTEI